MVNKDEYITRVLKLSKGKESLTIRLPFCKCIALSYNAPCYKKSGLNEFLIGLQPVKSSSSLSSSSSNDQNLFQQEWHHAFVTYCCECNRQMQQNNQKEAKRIE